MITSLMQTSDADLVTSARAGDAAAFEALVRRYQGLIYALAYHQIGNFADAQDVAQEVFIKAFRNIDRLQSPERFASWLKTIAINECKMALRGNRQTMPLDEAELSPLYISLAAQAWKRQERQAEIRRAVDSLPEKTGLIITMHYLSGLSHREIGEFLDTPANAVAQHLHRARRQLKQMLMENIEEDYAMNKLPENFAEEVLSKITLYPIKEGYFVTTDGKDGTGGITMAVGEEADKAYITFWMRSDDMGDIVLGTLPARTSETAKGRALDSTLQMLDAFGIKLEQVTLRLAEDRKCRARAEFTYDDGTVTVDMRPSDAMGLAVRVKAPICAEDAVVRQGNVGEDDVSVPDENIGPTLYNAEYERMRKSDVILDMAFEMVSLEDWVDTIRFHRDEANGVLRIWAEADSAREATFDLDEYGPGVNFIFDTAARRGSIGKVSGDPSRGWTQEYKFRFSMLGEDARMRVTAEHTGEEGKSGTDSPPTTA